MLMKRRTKKEEKGEAVMRTKKAENISGTTPSSAEHPKINRKERGGCYQ